jgi:dihydrofolate reductase
MSLDGYIAGPQGEADWIVMDPDVDFKEIFARFDTFLIGRRTFATMARPGKRSGWPGVKTVVFSTSLKASDFPGVEFVSRDAAGAVRKLKAEDGRDIWLFGGGELFRTLLNAGLVDAVGVAIVPVVLGGGIPFLPTPALQTKLKLIKHKVYPKSGIVSLEYDVVGSSAR